MIRKLHHRNLIWVDLEAPTQDEIRQVAREYHLNPIVVHDLSSPTLKPKVDLYDRFIYLILHFPKFRNQNGKSDQEIDFILGKKFLITVRPTAHESVHLFAKLFEAQAVLDKDVFGPHAGFIFFQMLRALYESLMHELSIIKDELGRIEGHIFSGEEKDMVKALSNVSRHLLDFKRSLSLHRDVFESLELAGRKFFGEQFSFELRALLSDYFRVEHAMQSNVEFLTELRETNNSLLSTKQNEVMKTLTILAFIALPATTVLSLFQIETSARPIVGSRFDFWILLLIVACIAAGLYVWFRRKKWL
ncbi:MAG: magnesium transporter CorA family protein [bacterium]|nr:magnesium transporter CorA family protein [bacterium]